MARWPLRLALTALLGLATSAHAGLEVPVDLGIGPQAVWFPGPLLDNRGAVPHFALAFDLEAVIDQQFIRSHRSVVPPRYRAMADKVTEFRMGASMFIPSTIYVSPPIEGLGSTGLYGCSWTPLGLTLASTRQRDEHHGFDVALDANALLTALFIHSAFEGVPTTFFLRPGLEFKLTFLLQLNDNLYASVGGGAMVYIPQVLGSFLDVTPIDQALWLAPFAFLKIHFRFPYEVQL